MSQAIGDPEELEQFANTLQNFIDTLGDAVRHLSSSFAALGDTWQDAKRAQFEADYEDLIRQLSVFETNASEQVPYLLTMAARLRDYLQS